MNASETEVESVPSTVIYEEIVAPSSTYSFTQCPAYAAANQVTDSCHHNSEICDLDVPTSHEGDIKIQQCSAYGVTTKKIEIANVENII